MRVIMSMIVLMPSWSYSLLMSNVLFKHSLGKTVTARTPRARRSRSPVEVGRACRSRNRTAARHDRPKPNRRHAPRSRVGRSLALGETRVGRRDGARSDGFLRTDGFIFPLVFTPVLITRPPLSCAEHAAQFTYRCD